MCDTFVFYYFGHNRILYFFNTLKYTTALVYNSLLQYEVGRVMARFVAVWIICVVMGCHYVAKSKTYCVCVRGNAGNLINQVFGKRVLSRNICWAIPGQYTSSGAHWNTKLALNYPYSFQHDKSYLYQNCQVFDQDHSCHDNIWQFFIYVPLWNLKIMFCS